MSDMVRRKLLTLIGSSAVAWPLAAGGQLSAISVIGILGGSAESFAPFEPVFRKGLNDVGFPDGSTAHFEFRWANGQVDRLPALAVDLVAQRPTVIATQTLPAALAAKAATSTIPVVFVIGEDPIKVGLVGSLSRSETECTRAVRRAAHRRRELVPASSSLGSRRAPRGLCAS
jgi:putative ABC transport system substrate-binding protein